MNVLKIAWRSIQHRGLGSLLTIISMALGVMLVVAVLTIHGVVSESFKSNNSFGYNILVGARGGGLQLTLNTVYYLSTPVENIPYEYYLAFCDADTRSEELKNSIAFTSHEHEAKTRDFKGISAPGGGGLGASLTTIVAKHVASSQQLSSMKIGKSGLYDRYTHMAVPLCLGDYYVDEESGDAFRCVGTKPGFFKDLVLDVDTQEKFQFAEGRSFEEYSDEFQYFECVIGSAVTRRCGLKIGDVIQPTHGDPSSSNAHIHEQGFTIVGLVDHTGTPHDRAVFLNLEGFFLMADHSKPVEDERMLKATEEDPEEQSETETAVDEFDMEEDELASSEQLATSEQLDSSGQTATSETDDTAVLKNDESADVSVVARDVITHTPLPIEQREVTSILIRTSTENDPHDVLGIFLPTQINGGDLETTLAWSPHRPMRAQKAAQAVNPIMQIASLFEAFVNPIRSALLLLTFMICVVSALSILVGIYNSMNQRQHEIAVMRALGAGRTKVMLIMLCEAVLLALAGGLLGWFSGHALNAGLGPMIEDKTGVQIGFFDFAPGIPLGFLPGASNLPSWLVELSVSPELLLIPALILLAVAVGIYPAISAYRTDVSKALGK